VSGAPNSFFFLFRIGELIMIGATHSRTKLLPPSQSDDSELLLSPNGVCAVLRVNRKTLDNMTPQPPYFLLGKRRFITLRALRDWIDSKQKAALRHA